MADTGWVSAGLGQSIGLGDVDWTNPTNIYTSNNAHATAALAEEQVTDYLRATTFGFAIPGGATIDGIEARIERKASGLTIVDSVVKLVKGGVEQGDNKAAGDSWPAADAYKEYGGAADKWGSAFAPADINAANFGVSVSAYAVANARTAYVDHIQIKVYYTEPATNMKINISDVMEDVAEIKINIGDVWKDVIKIQINIADVWEDVFG